MSTISLCMIVKNEERHLARCLDSVAELVEEIIIVDTSTAESSLQRDMFWVISVISGLSGRVVFSDMVSSWPANDVSQQKQKGMAL